MRDEKHPIDGATLKAVERFLTDGTGPFFGDDVTESLREAVRLQHIVVAAETPVLDQESGAVAA